MGIADETETGILLPANFSRTEAAAAADVEDAAFGVWVSLSPEDDDLSVLVKLRTPPFDMLKQFTFGCAEFVRPNFAGVEDRGLLPFPTAGVPF